MGQLGRSSRRCNTVIDILKWKSRPAIEPCSYIRQPCTVPVPTQASLTFSRDEKYGGCIKTGLFCDRLPEHDPSGSSYTNRRRLGAASRAPGKDNPSHATISCYHRVTVETIRRPSPLLIENLDDLDCETNGTKREIIFFSDGSLDSEHGCSFSTSKLIDVAYR